MKNIYFSTTLRAAIHAHRASDFSQARSLYYKALSEEPDKPEALFNIGLLLLNLKEFSEAAHYFERLLILVPSHTRAQYYLANCYFSLENFSQAKTLYQSVILADPGHVDALNNLGALLLHENQIEQALQCFSAILSTHPEHTEARNNMAGTLFQLNRYRHAAEHYRLLLTLTPNDLQAQYSYAIALLESQQLPEAIQQFQQILVHEPHHPNALSNLGIAYIKADMAEQAIPLFAQSLQLQPQNPTVSYLYAALTQNNFPPMAPTEYVKNLFDHYATYYDLHTIDRLNYTVPQQLRQCWDQYAVNLRNKNWQLLDLGCGTGLSGMAFKDIAQPLDGVDISPQMLASAAKKNIYHRLIENDLITALSENPHRYQILLAADTFNYFGDFAALFNSCYHALTDEGYVLFSAEAITTYPWQLQKNTRYAHSKEYIEEIAQQSGFTLKIMQSTVLRKQAHADVIGWLILLHKGNNTHEI